MYQPWFEIAFLGRRGTVLIGYFRPCPDDDAAAQRRVLAEAGCEQIVEERLGVDDGDARSELGELLARLHPGDVIVVPGLDSLGSSLSEVARQVQRLAAAGFGFAAWPRGWIPQQPGHVRI